MNHFWEDYPSHDSPPEEANKIKELIRCQEVSKVCFEKIKQNGQWIRAIKQRNHEIIQRYQTIQKLPYFDMTVESSMIPANWNYALYAHKILVLNALLDIQEGTFDKGIILLSNEIRFYRENITKNIDLGFSYTSLRALNSSYHLLSLVVADKNFPLSRYQNEIVPLLEPLSVQEQQMLVRPMQLHLQYLLLDLLKDPLLPKDISPIEVSEDTANKFIDRNKEANYLFLDAKKYLELASLPVPQLLDKLAKIKESALESEMPGYKNNKQYPTDIFFWRNIVGLKYRNDGDGVLFRSSDHEKLYNLYNRINLVALQFQIQQNKLQQKDVPGLLKKTEERAMNPFTDTSFKWEPLKQVLSTEDMSRFFEKHEPRTISVQLVF